MKIRKRLLTMLGVIVASVFVLGIVAVASGGYGTESDPLVTLSYLTDVFKPSMETEITNTVNTKSASLKSSLDSQISSVESQYGTAASSKTFSVISLESGKKLVCKKGCEIMLRIGSVYCVAPASPGLIDTTTADVIENGSYLTKNHMYMVTIDGRGIKADGSVMVVIRGDYSIE